MRQGQIMPVRQALQANLDGGERMHHARAIAEQAERRLGSGPWLRMTAQACACAASRAVICFACGFI
jgi:hypothetical protein